MDSSKWNFEENKAFEGVIATFPEEFEEAMAMFPDDLPDRWKTKTAETIEGKNQLEVCNHFRAPYEDLQAIYTGKVELPAYKDDLHLPEKKVRGRKPGSKNRPKPIVLEPKIERKKIRQWTENEHRLFLAGLKKYPGSDWRSISRHCVKTRTPSQVASHAQKYYERQNSRKEKVKSRYSIHDMELSESELNELEQSGAVPGAAGRCPDQVEQPNLPPSTTMLPSFESPKFEENAGQVQLPALTSTVISAMVEQLIQAVPGAAGLCPDQVEQPNLHPSTTMLPWFELPRFEENVERMQAVPGAAGLCPDQVEQPNLHPSTTMLPWFELPRFEENVERMQAVPGAAGLCPDPVEQPNLHPSTTMLPWFELPRFEENVERMPMPMPMPAPTSAIMGQLPIGHAGMPALASYIGGQLPSPLIQSHRLQRDYSGPPRFLPSFSYGDLHEMMKFGS